MILFKLIVVGDAAVGKSSLMNNYLGNPFMDNEVPTIGVDFGSKIMDGKKVILEELKDKYYKKTNSKKNTDIDVKTMIWNTSGQERFHSIVTSYYRKTDGAIFVCDMTRRETLEHLNYWINDYNKSAVKPLSEIGAVIVANKSDLLDDQEVSKLDLDALAEQYQIPYFIVSSKMDLDKITLVFENLANQMFANYLENPIIEDPDMINLNKPRNVFNNFKNCCTII